MNRVWEIIQASLVRATQKHPLEFHAAVCMSNHYHMVVRTPAANIDQVMFEFNSHFSRLIRVETGLINRMLGQRYYWGLVTDDCYYLQVMKYLFLNPVKASIVAQAQDYQYSTLYHQVHKHPWPIEISSFKDFSSLESLNWINQLHTEEQNNAIKVGMKKPVFKFGLVEGTKKPPEF